MQDIEGTVEAHKALRPGCSAAFSIPTDGVGVPVPQSSSSEEGLAVVAELRNAGVRSHAEPCGTHPPPSPTFHHQDRLTSPASCSRWRGCAAAAACRGCCHHRRPAQAVGPRGARRVTVRAVAAEAPHCSQGAVHSSRPCRIALPVGAPGAQCLPCGGLAPCACSATVQRSLRALLTGLAARCRQRVERSRGSTTSTRS